MNVNFFFFFKFINLRVIFQVVYLLGQAPGEPEKIIFI